MILLKTYTKDFAVSKDGTKIGYRQMGTGPGLILIHGGMMAAQNFMTLGSILSDNFTVYILDRRGRGLSGGYGNNYSLEKDCEDIEAILNKTDTHNVFGLSSGAVIALESSRRFPSIHKVALYEPPLPVNGSKPDAWVPRFEKELSENKLAEAMVTVLKGTGDSWSFASLPRFILIPLLKLGVKADLMEIKNDDVAIKELIPTMHYDAQLISEMRGKFETFKNVNAKMLLLTGTKSNSFLKEAIKELHKLLPQSHLVQFPGLGHTAADNGNKASIVAEELKNFFA